ncbi:hypothetical protein [Photobacterium sp. R1]
MKQSKKDVERTIAEQIEFARRMQHERVPLVEYISFWYGKEWGAKSDFARDQGVSSQQVNRWLNLGVYLENGKLNRPDPKPIKLLLPDWIASYC